jgi:hypothetical protein
MTVTDVALKQYRPTVNKYGDVLMAVRWEQ